MKQCRPLILGLAIFLLTAAYASAQPKTGLFFNVKWGKTDANGSIGNVLDSVVDGDDDSQAIEIGWRFGGLVAFQVGYHELGDLAGSTAPCLTEDEACPTVEIPIEAKTTAYSVTFVPQLPLTRSFSIFAKVGVVGLESEVSAILDDTSEFIEDFSDEDILYGAGLKLRFVAGLSLFYEYEFFGSDLEVQSLGVSYQF